MEPLFKTKQEARDAAAELRQLAESNGWKVLERIMRSNAQIARQEVGTILNDRTLDREAKLASAELQEAIARNLEELCILPVAQADMLEAVEPKVDDDDPFEKEAPEED